MMVLTALLGGLRRGEVFAIHWTDDPENPRTFVDFENNVIRVRKALFWLHGKHHEKRKDRPGFVFITPKSKKSVRDVPLWPMLKREMKAFYLRATDKTGLLFQTAKGTPVDPDNVCGRTEKEKRDNKRARSPKQAKRNEVRLPPPPAATLMTAVKHAGIGHVRFHDLRHSCGSHKLDQGAYIYDVQRWMDF
jgi:integrase